MSKTKHAHHLAIFQEQTIRRIWQNEEWWFSVVDVISVLTDSLKPRDYWYRMKERVGDEEKIELSTFCRQLKVEATDGKKYSTDCANTEGLLRIIQSIPSPKAEPFKRWLAQVGYERVKEIENPELASLRARQLYEAKGYPREWIEKRLRSIDIRGELTKEWQERGVKEGLEYSILTAEIARATFGITPGEHKTIKGLDKVNSGNNLRDHMTDLELIFTMLGEASTTEIAKKRDAQGFEENHTAAVEGGTISGNARKELESKTGEPVVSKQNFLNLQSTGITHEVKITHTKIPSFKISGITVRTKNQDEADPSLAKLADHWSRFFSQGIAEKIPHRLPDSPIYGVYSDYESDFTSYYNLTAGVSVSEKSEEFQTVEVQAGTYMLFESKGPMPQVVIDTWVKIWQFFNENPNVKRKYTTDFEIYQGTDEISICIAIEE